MKDVRDLMKRYPTMKAEREMSGDNLRIDLNEDRIALICRAGLSEAELPRETDRRVTLTIWSESGDPLTFHNDVDVAEAAGVIEVYGARERTPPGRIRFSTTTYEFSHGRKPRGRGTWAFEIKGDVWFAFTDSTFADAKKQARAEAARRNETFVVVLP